MWVFPFILMRAVSSGWEEKRSLMSRCSGHSYKLVIRLAAWITEATVECNVLCVFTRFDSAPVKTHRAGLTCCVRDATADRIRAERVASCSVLFSMDKFYRRDIELIQFGFVPQFKTHCSDHCSTSMLAAGQHSSFNSGLTDQCGGSQHVTHTDHGVAPTPPCSVL